MNEIQKLAKWIEASNNIVFLGGAGVSTESNIPDFRSSSGIYSKDYKEIAPERILSHSFFVSHTDDFFRFYREEMIYPDAKPNAAHTALALLERAGKLKAVITQNIDGLHQMAGSSKVLELHGSVYQNRCMDCHRSYNLSYILSSKSVPLCESCSGIVKPVVTLYEEALNMDIFEEAIAYIANADVLIVGGTSLTVYPAASLTRYYQGDKLVLINRDSTSYDRNAALIIREPIGATLGEVVKTLNLK